jgi:predicted O-methyltransferase YrrM
MNNELCFGQRIDPASGLIQPWFTHGALDEIANMDLSQKIILMFGAGRGDAWLSRRCKKLIVVERNPEWLRIASESSKNNGCDVEYIFRPCNEGSGAQDIYCVLPDEDIDIIINDDAYRTEVCQLAVDYFSKKPFGGILICDNWHQDYVWLSPKAEEIMQPYSSKIFSQPDHRDFENEGCEWKTAIFYL